MLAMQQLNKLKLFMNKHGDIMKDIGSFVELEFAKGKELFQYIPETDKIRLNTCRAAIAHAVKCYNVNKVWIAKYQCDVVRDFLIKQGFEVLYYDIDEKFKPILESNEIDSAIVLTNYFGILGDKHFDLLVKKYNNVIIDNAQALFYHPRTDSISCYSPRKFVASPDGAYVIGRNVNRFEYKKDVSSISAQFLLMRGEFGCDNECYKNKKENDKRIDSSDILIMSDLTQTLLDSFDYEKIIKIRQENYRYSRSLFDQINKIDIENIGDKEAAPMGYPLWIDNVEIIPEFHKKRIYQARFWEYLIQEDQKQTIEYHLAKYMALICLDQRYGKEEIDYQAEIVRRCVSKY